MTARKLAALVAVAVAGVVLYATPAGAAVLEQAQNVKRYFYPIKVETNHSDAALEADQTGSGSIINAKDGGTSEFTIDQSSSTTINPININGSSNAYQLAIKSAPTQSTPPFVVKDSAGTPVASIDNAGALTVSSVVGSTLNDLNGGSLTWDPTGNTKSQATADNILITTLGGTPTAAAFTVKDSQGVAVFTVRGNGQMSGLNAMVVATAAPVAGVASTAIAPTGLLQPVSMATAGTVPLTIPAAGTRLCIWNTGSEVVTIADTGNQILTAAAALGQYDVLCGFSDGTRFIETSRADN